MLQEGYMMQTSDVAPTQHQFRAKLVSTIGEAKTDSFYTVWLDSHFSRIDVDSMKSWGFNSVRVAMHYKWFTRPLNRNLFQDKTWLEKGFTMIDSLLDWCADNEMYLILDLHGRPADREKMLLFLITTKQNLRFGKARTIKIKPLLCGENWQKGTAMNPGLVVMI
jgi:endoglucanase